MLNFNLKTRLQKKKIKGDFLFTPNFSRLICGPQIFHNALNKAFP